MKLWVTILLSTGMLWAQNSAEITGTVTDKTGALVAGAEIVIVNTKTGTERKAVSNEGGAYTIPFLTPGDGFTVTVQKPGFRQAKAENLRLEVNQVARLDFALEVGAVTESVNVSASAALIEADSSAVGQVVETKAIQDLPLNGRNFVQLAILAPGVSGVGFGSRGTIMSGTRPDDLRPGSELFANGNREGSNNFLIDGADNNERLTLSIVLRPSVEAVREFKMQTNMFAAEQGRNPGATVNIITKSGSNELHGSAYEFLRNDIIDAKNFFTPAGGKTPELRQHQFGASAGGPVFKNKLFFFTNYEGYRRKQEKTFVNTVPTAEMRVGDFGAVRDIFDPLTTRAAAGTASGYTRDPFPNRQIPLDRFDAVTRKLVNAYPLPQRAGLVNNHTTVPGEQQRWDQGDGRMDWNWNEKNSVFGRFSRQDTTTTRPSTFTPVTLPGLSSPVSLGNEDTFAGSSNLKTYNAVLNWVHTFSPSFIAETKMGYGRFNLNFIQEGASPGARLGEQLGVKNANQGPASDGIPIFSPAGYTGIGQTRSLPIIRIENTFHPGVSFTKLMGAHSIKFGGDLRRRQVTQFQVNRGNGRFNFGRTFTTNPNSTATSGDGMAEFLLGAANTIEQDFTLVFPGIRMAEWGGFLQDDWKVTRNLTFNIGLRYEYDTPVSEVTNRWTNFNPFTGKLLISGFNTDSNTGVRPDRNNFAPRFGFAYQARPGTVIRGGYGIFYDAAGSESVMMRRHRQLPFGPINAEDINAFSPTPRRVQDGLRPIPVLDFNVVANNPTGAMLAIDQGFVAPYVQQFNLQIQQQLPKEMVAKIGFVGNMGRKLDNSYDFNQPVPGPGAAGPRRPLFTLAPNVVGVTYELSEGISSYNSLQATLEKRFASGIGFLTSYAMAKSIDNGIGNAFGGADNGPLPQDRRYRALDRGISGFDIKHRFTTAMNYALPFGVGRKHSLGSRAANVLLGGWDMNTIFTAQTGLPFTPVLASSVSNAGGSRPDRFKEGSIGSPGPARWFDTSFNASGSAWGVPAIYTFGNSARNVLRAPGRVNVDYSIFKEFAFTERTKLQFRTEIFNLFNTPQFNPPDANIGSPSAGIISSIVGTPRQFQFGLRLAF
jgi:hypothetical protein